MNTANPQLEGLYLAFASINRLLVGKGLVSHAELREALHEAERQVLSDGRPPNVSQSHQKAIAFPIRVLLLANDSDEKGESLDFEDLARAIGRQT